MSEFFDGFASVLQGINWPSLSLYEWGEYAAAGSIGALGGILLMGAIVLMGLQRVYVPARPKKEEG